MKKLLSATAIVLIALAFFWPSRAPAQQFALPALISISTTSTNASIVLSTTAMGLPASSVYPPSQYYPCIQHLTVTSVNAGTFMLVTATVTASNTLSAGTTNYSVVLSSGVPYDSQWAPQAAWCAQPGNQLSLVVTGGGAYTISCEAFTTKGWNP